MEQYLATKINKLFINPTAWMNLKGIELSEKSHSQKENKALWEANVGRSPEVRSSKTSLANMAKPNLY